MGGGQLPVAPVGRDDGGMGVRESKGPCPVVALGQGNGQLGVGEGVVPGAEGVLGSGSPRRRAVLPRRC